MMGLGTVAGMLRRNGQLGVDGGVIRRENAERGTLQWEEEFSLRTYW